MISHLSGFIISRFNPSPILGDLAASKCVGFFSADVAALDVPFLHSGHYVLSTLNPKPQLRRFPSFGFS